METHGSGGGHDWFRDTVAHLYSYLIFQFDDLK